MSPNQFLKQCLICKDDKDTFEIIQLTNPIQTFCKSCLMEHIKYADLGIDINNADFDEWIPTALNDTYYDGNYRFRNPHTNLQFLQTDLETIYFHCRPDQINEQLGTQLQIC
jgi:hypothetical protein